MTRPARLRALGTCVVVAAAALGAAACGSEDAAAPTAEAATSTTLSSTPSTTPSTTPSPAATPEEPAPEADQAASSPAGDDVQGRATSALLDGTRRVDVQLYTGQWLVPDVEGGLTVVDRLEDADLPTSFVFTPVSTAATEHLVVTETTTDGAPSCLRVVDVETVALATCDPADPAQLVRVASLDAPEQVGMTTSLGPLVAGVDGRLAVAADPGEPNSVFTLAERGLSTRS